MEVLVVVEDDEGGEIGGRIEERKEVYSGYNVVV